MLVPVESFVALGLLIWLMIAGVTEMTKSKHVYCNVHGFPYECTGHPHNFYQYVFVVAVALLFCYVDSCFYRYGENVWHTF